jgi:hypothetical protein
MVFEECEGDGREGDELDVDGREGKGCEAIGAGCVEAG